MSRMTKRMAGHDSPARARGRIVLFLERLRSAILSAVEEESVRADEAAAAAESVNLIDRLPEPPHLQPGELKYGRGMHDYF